jgi:hypothetical protein
MSGGKPLLRHMLSGMDRDRLTFTNLDDWLTVHHSITFYHQLDAQTSYLFTYNTFIKILYMFRALLCYVVGLRLRLGRRRNCIYAVSGIVTLCR